MFNSFSRDRTPKAGRLYAGLSSGVSLFSLPKILKLLQLIRLPNECIEQSEIGIIHHGRSEPVFLPQRRA